MNCCGRGILELKCPFSGREYHPNELKLAMKRSFLYEGGLIKSHRY